jgi:hypothetical protein
MTLLFTCFIMLLYKMRYVMTLLFTWVIMLFYKMRYVMTLLFQVRFVIYIYIKEQSESRTQQRHGIYMTKETIFLSLSLIFLFSSHG